MSPAPQAGCFGDEVSTTTRLRVGLSIAYCQLPISDWRLATKPIGNPQSKIENPQAHPLPRGGTDLMAPVSVMPQGHTRTSHLRPY